MANPVERARRRQREQAARGETVTLAEVLRTQEARDRRDAARDLAPMVPAADAVELDTTQLSLDQVVDRMEQEVRKIRNSNYPYSQGTDPSGEGEVGTVHMASSSFAGNTTPSPHLALGFP